MNIFYLDKDARKCAEQHCDKHVVKMILESAQMLCTAHIILDKVEMPYKKTHADHPSAVWTRANIAHYDWLYTLFISLSNEYTFRYGKTHKSFRILREILKTPPNNINKDFNFTEPPQCMPEQYKDNDIIIAYRNYYLGEKKELLKYTKRKTPDWIF